MDTGAARPEVGSATLPVGRVGLFDPPPELVRLSEEQPICWLRFANGETGWLVSDYALGSAVLSDLRFGVPRVASRHQVGEFQRASVESIVRDRIDAMDQLGSAVDFVETFALPVAARLLPEALGLPSDEHVETVVSTQFAYGLFTLLLHPFRWEALKQDLTAIDAVVEELLRYLTIFDTNPTRRCATEDVWLGGVEIKRGDIVVVSALAGNRDRNRYENPDDFDPGREPREHLTFGAGASACPGRDLARLVLQVGLAALARRFPTLRLAATPEELCWLPDVHELSGPLTLPVSW